VPTSNFAFLSAHDAQPVKLGVLAERYFRDDPVTSIFKLRQFAERVAPARTSRGFPCALLRHMLAS